MKKLLIPCFALASLMMACNGSQTDSTSTDSVGDASRSASDTSTMVNTDHDSNDGMGSMNSDSSNKTDFVNDAAAGGLMEVQLGELAKTHAASQAVKDFGAMMVRDHSKANDELKTVAAKNNLTLPTTMPDIQRNHVEDLSKKNGADFDKDYISMMVDDHEEDIKMFERCAKSDKDNADVKAFAAKTLPTLYKHLEAAKKIKNTMK